MRLACAQRGFESNAQEASTTVGKSRARQETRLFCWRRNKGMKRRKRSRRIRGDGRRRRRGGGGGGGGEIRVCSKDSYRIEGA
jgi:hypothetical protein